VINSSHGPLPDNTQHSQQKNIHAPAEFEPTISAGEQPQTYTFYHAATVTRFLQTTLQIFPSAFPLSLALYDTLLSADNSTNDSLEGLNQVRLGVLSNSSSSYPSARKFSSRCFVTSDCNVEVTLLVDSKILYSLTADQGQAQWMSESC
jgi:hypothetical protein